MKPSTIKIVKATAPVLKAHGTAITSRMYEIMFHDYPDVRNLFNQSHHIRSDGAKVSAQAQTLANAVYGYAAHIDELDKLKEAIPRMVNKHVSLNILPEHYPIVGTCILRSIKEILGDAATTEILDAWKEAYFSLANLLIDLEQKAKKEFEAGKGGWTDGFHPLVISKKVKESHDMMSIYFKKDINVETKCQSQEDIQNGVKPELSLPSFAPGQFLSVRFQLPTQTFVRNYSISNAPGEDALRISVKLDGKVSTLLHFMDVGSKVEVGIPAGDLTLDDSVDGPLVFLHAGSGVTPFMSMLESMQKGVLPKRDVYCLQYHHNPQYHAFSKTIDEMAQNKSEMNVYPYAFFQENTVKADLESTKIGEGRFSTIHLTKLFSENPKLREEAHFYMVGSTGFMEKVHSSLTKELKIEPERVHNEFFGPTQNGFMEKVHSSLTKELKIEPERVHNEFFGPTQNL